MFIFQLLDSSIKVFSFPMPIILGRRCKTVGEGEPILLERVNSTIFRKVLYWCTYHRDDDDENKRRRMYDVASWEREFFRAGKSSLLDLLLAATYLAFVHFRDVCSRVLSDTPMRGTHPEVRGALNAYSEENQSTSNY